MTTKNAGSVSPLKDERVSVIVVTRDRYSVTDGCLETLFKHTSGHDVIVVIGGAPDRVRRRLEEKFGQKAKLIFESRFLNPAEGRNVGMSACKTRLAVLMDNDIYVKSGWLEPLVRCQQETGAAMVVPLILEYEREIHTAGNHFYITHDNGYAYAHKELRFHGMVYSGSSNLQRIAIEYGELHCQLVEVATAVRLNAYDENIREVGECDSGLTWGKNKCPMFFEPASVVNYNPPVPETIAAEDIRFFAWRWDMRGILEGYRYFQHKWKIDITEHGNFRNFLLGFNRKLGLIPRLFPCELSLKIDLFIRKISVFFTKIFMTPSSVWNRFKAWLLGYYAWPASMRDENWQVK